jgi:16S rRNA processing protein RimM
MRVEDSFYFGKIVRKHSYKGEIVVKLDPDYFELMIELESIWIVQNNHLVPFFMENMSYQRETFFRVKLEGVDTEIEADKLMGSAIYLNKDFLPKSKGNDFYKHEIIGFDVIDVNHGNIGKIERVNDTTPQLLFEINNENKILLIPAIPEFLQKIDRKKKTITVVTPDGLLEL